MGLFSFLGGGKTYVTNNTGLGDTQMVELTDNQKNIVTGLNDGFTATGKRFDTVDSGITGIGANLDTGFTDLTKLGDKLYKNLTDADAGRKSYYNAYFDALGNTASGLATQDSVDTGFFNASERNRDVDKRFDTLDTSVGNVQSTADTIGTDVGDVQTSLNDGFTALNDGFVNSNTRFDTLDTAQANAAKTAEALGGQLTDAQTNVLGGQDTLQNSLDAMSGTADTYAAQSLENQAGLASNQEGFTSSFDDYVERYGEDAELAQQTRSDMQLANANANKKLREDIGNYANATADGQVTLSDTLLASNDTLGAAVEGGFTDLNEATDTLGTTVEGGFTTLGEAYETTQNNLAKRMTNLKSILNQTGADLDANTRAQYEALSSSFDASGELITNSIDAQGNTITRTIDDQGNIISNKFDISGKQVDQVITNVDSVLTQAEKYQVNTGTLIDDLGNVVTTGFDNTSDRIDGATDSATAGFADVNDSTAAGFADINNNMTVSNNDLTDLYTANNVDFNNNIDNLRTDISTGLETTNSNLDNLNLSLEDGFGNVDANQVIAAKDLANVVATQNDIEMGMRQNFYQLGNAFDENGTLIQSSIDAQGNTITRSMDEQGNLLLRSFDVTGRAIGEKVINIRRSLDDIQNLQNVQGANASMGNLSPAMSGQVPVSGFASPFATTR
jgi:uncharacterized tellurite resistance protein B-like protein